MPFTTPRTTKEGPIMSTKLLQSMLIALLLLLPLTAIADDTPAKPADTPKVETPIPSFFAETTVTATGSKRDVFEIATPVTVIREQTIEQKSPQNAAELLREQPGVDVNGVGPNQGRPVIRGQRGLRVLFLENGLRMNNPRRQTDFGEVTGLVDLNSVGTIEVVRGPASVLYGTDAIGGVLNLVSKEPSFPANTHFTGLVEGRYSSSGKLASGSAGVNGRFGALTMQLGGTKRQVDEKEAPPGTLRAIRRRT